MPVEGLENIALLAVAGVLLIVFVSWLAPRLGVAAPVLLVVVGIACSFIPGAPEILVEPEWILLVVLPPILYSAAVNVPVMDFRRNFGAIGALSVLLVLVSAFGTGLLIWWIMPDIGLAAAIALGAVISPPDAVAATSIGKRLGLPPRLVTILEGEGLVNDATALVLMRTAVAAIAGSFSLWEAVGEFAMAVLIGAAIGGLVGIVSVWVRSRIRQQPVLTTAISLVVPFIAYVPAEELHASGVLAVVVAGLITGHESVSRFSAQDRISERTNWRTIQLLLENGVFLLMGFEITAIVGEVTAEDQSGLWGAVGIGLLATLALVVMRILFVAPLIGLLRRQQQRAERLAPRLDEAVNRIASRTPLPGQTGRFERADRILRRRQADVAFLRAEGLGWRGGAVLAWSGMRGVVTLAAAQSLPSDVPHRAELVLVAFTVALVTLVMQGGTLPLLIRVLGIQGTDEEHERRELARLATELSDVVTGVLDSPTLLRENGETFDRVVIDSIRERQLSASGALEAMLHPEDEDGWVPQLRELRRLVIDAELSALLDARGSGTYSSRTLERAQQLIDSELARMEKPDTGH